MRAWSCLLAVLVVLNAGALKAEVLVKDSKGQTVSITDNTRAISIGGAITEIIYALGLSDRIVAVDSTSQYPERATSKPNVGYMRQLSAEPILSLEPSLVVAIEDSGPVTALDQLKEAGLSVVIVPDDPTPDGVITKIKLIAKIFNAEDAGKALATRFKADLRKTSQDLSGATSRPRVLFLLSIGAGRPPLAAGRDTAAAGIIKLAGGENAIDAFKGYKPLSPEAIIAAAPDAILVTHRSMNFLGGIDGVLALPEIQETPAGQSKQILAMDGLLLLGFGPRTGTAARQLARKLHPEVKFAADMN